MKPKTITYTLAAGDPNGLVTTVTPGSAGSFTLGGALCSGGVGTMDDPRRISFTSDGDESGDTYSVIGTDRYGVTQTEDVTGPNATTVYSARSYKTVTAISTDGAGTGNITIGSADKAETQWIPVERAGFYSVDYDITVGNAMVEVEGTLEDPFISGFDESSVKTIEVSDAPVRAIRAAMTEIDGTNGITMTLTIVCPS